MEWIEQSNNYTYLRKFCEDIDPANEEQLIFKMRLKWLLDISVEQAQALLSIEQAQNSDLSIPPPPKISLGPRFQLIKGGKDD